MGQPEADEPLVQKIGMRLIVLVNANL